MPKLGNRRIAAIVAFGLACLAILSILKLSDLAGDNHRDDSSSAMTVYEFDAKSINGDAVSMAAYRGNVLLIVNVASQCGFTPQYAGLQQLYEKYKDRGLTVLGFPSNQFGGQEPGTESEIQAFCQKNFGVTFPLFSKIDVNGQDAHPLYGFLKNAQPGILGTELIKWNFTKFLVDRSGHVVNRYGPQEKPESLEKDIEAALNASS